MTAQKEPQIQNFLGLLGAELYNLRVARREKQKTVAQAISVNTALLSKVENRRCPTVTIDLLFKLANYYGTTVHELMCRIQDKSH